MSRVGYEFFHSMKLADVARSHNRPVVSLAPTDTVELALKRMADNKVLSLPIIDKSNRLLALVDGLDILAFALSVQEKVKAHDKETLTIAARALALKTVSEIVDLSGRDPLVTLNVHNTVSMAAQLMAGGIHRTPVVDDADACLFTFSQSDVVRLLSTQIGMGKLVPLGAMTLEKLGLGQQGAVQIGLDASIVDAMDAIKSKGISAVAVTETNGQLAGNFSAADLRGLYSDHLPDLAKPVKDYLEQYHPESFNCVTARPETQLKDVVKDLAESHLHRVWVIDGDNKPIGVVSLRDVIDVVLSTTV